MPEWSSPSPISRAESIIASLFTPRISPALSVTPVPGTKAPGRAATPSIPVRALGAPQTTDSSRPSPTSTRSARRRSALGCGAASITRAMRKGASAAPRSSTPSTSMPMADSVLVMRSSGASVSRCARSQESGNFMVLQGLPRPVATMATRFGMRYVRER